ncbi:hypothetical protein SmJEL517_g03821 [Synchytrium microbalum]|uniref:[RNA-polymerase]-subunit kinase n=1 Tax=Synchytrium microbalum TaxID=1806994 RepID=A0A507C1C2_9FUNG|nr:uncharacterized protein SmJEL517_g03821 [Synchytrium microbalum]TPX33221.1 hypothetical protein SmJEL517_g03821 [Synchytrium microbalum]
MAATGSKELWRPINSSKELYSKEEKIGEGTYAHVFKGKIKATGREIAIKKIKLGHVKKHLLDESVNYLADNPSRQFRDGVNMSAIREVKALQELRHPNIIELVDVYMHKGNLHLILEFLQCDLEMVIKDTTLTFKQEDVKSWMLMITRGLYHCHRNNLLHRDMKPNNILISPDGLVKLADFGLTREFGEWNRPMSPQAVTRWYKPPELLLSATTYGSAVDMWSTACIFAELFIRSPFLVAERDSDMGQLDVILKALGTPTVEEWNYMPLNANVELQLFPKPRSLQQYFTAARPDAIDLMRKMFEFDPNKRISAEEALRHPYFTNLPRPTPPPKLPVTTKQIKPNRDVYLGPEAVAPDAGPRGTKRKQSDDDDQDASKRSKTQPACALPHISAQKQAQKKSTASSSTKKNATSKGERTSSEPVTASTKTTEISPTSASSSASPVNNHRESINPSPEPSPIVSTPPIASQQTTSIKPPILPKAMPNNNQPSSLSIQLQHQAQQRQTAAGSASSLHATSRGVTNQYPSPINEPISRPSQNIPISRPPTFAEPGQQSRINSVPRVIYSDIEYDDDNEDHDGPGAILPSSLNELLTPSEQIQLSRSAGKTSLESYFGGAQIPMPNNAKRRDEYILTAPASPLRMNSALAWSAENGRQTLLNARSLPNVLGRYYRAAESVHGDDVSDLPDDERIEDDDEHHVPFLMEEEEMVTSSRPRRNGSNSNLSGLAGSPVMNNRLSGLAGSPGGSRANGIGMNHINGSNIYQASSSYGSNGYASNGYQTYGQQSLGLGIVPDKPNGVMNINLTARIPSDQHAQLSYTSPGSYLAPTQRGPRMMSYSSVARTGVEENVMGALPARHETHITRPQQELELLCPFAQQGTCRFGDKCKYLHGLPCPVCQKLVLHPQGSSQEHTEHIASCQRKQAIINARNAQADHADDLECVICFEVIKKKKDPRFGLMKCPHPVCLDCIRQWRLNEAMDNSKTCPICRTVTHFVIPSTVWISDEMEKERVIEIYQQKLATMDCKHFDNGRGQCPFGNSCFYRHAYADGSLEQVKKRWVTGGGEEESKIVGPTRLADFLSDYMERA